jgi:hypothetical protein
VSLLPVLAKIKKNEEGFLVHIYLVPTTVPWQLKGVRGWGWGHAPPL